MFSDIGQAIINSLAEQMIPPRDVWQIAFDGSGPLNQDDVHYAFAGVIGSRPSWGAFAERWEPILNEFDLPYFRTVDAMNFRGPFTAKSAEWGDQRIAKRDDLLWRLAKLSRSLDMRPVGLAVQVGGLSEKDAGHRKREVFQTVIANILAAHQDRYFFLICDTEHDAADHYRRWLANLQQRDETAKRIACLCFADDKVLAAVQLADFAAYLLREEAARDCFRPTEEPNPLMVELRQGAGPEFSPFGRMLNGKIVS